MSRRTNSTEGRYHHPALWVNRGWSDYVAGRQHGTEGWLCAVDDQCVPPIQKPMRVRSKRMGWGVLTGTLHRPTDPPTQVVGTSSQLIALKNCKGEVTNQQCMDLRLPRDGRHVPTKA